MNIPATGATTLRLTVGRHSQGDWTLVVKVNDREVHRTPVDAETTVDTWLDVPVDLSAYAGHEVDLTLVNEPSAWAWEAAYWGRITIVTH